MDYEINFYETLSGKYQAKIDLLEMKVKSQILYKAMLASINKLKNKEYHKEPVSKHLEPGIMYARAKAGSNWGRMFYTFGPNKQIFLLCGFAKNSDNIPGNEIERARQLRDEYNGRQK